MKLKINNGILKEIPKTVKIEQYHFEKCQTKNVIRNLKILWYNLKQNLLKHIKAKHVDATTTILLWMSVIYIKWKKEPIVTKLTPKQRK